MSRFSTDKLADVESRVVLNLLPIRAGGGLQKTASLIRAFGESGADLSRFSVIVRGDSLLERVSDQVGLQKRVVTDSLANRLQFEIRSRFLIEKGTVCFTVSGPVMLGSVGHLINVTECAYSNLLYPELDFWSGFSGFGKRKKALIDAYRKKMIKAADFWIFQTDVLRERAVERFGFPEERTRIVKISPSVNVGRRHVVDDLRHRYDSLIPKGIRLLFLNGPNPNKRVHLVPKLIKALSRRGMDNAVVVTTLPADHKYTELVEKCFREEGVESQLFNMGPIITDHVSSCIDCCNAVCTFSVLESFSNNFIEAWAMQKPLIATDSDWARSAAGSGALYVDVLDPDGSADKIFDLMSNQNTITSLLAAGEKRLDWYSTPLEKLRDYLGVLADAERLGACPSKIRERIRW